MPKLRQIDLAWPMWRYPFGSGGKRVTTRPPHLPVRRSSSTIRRTKSSPPASCPDGAWLPSPPAGLAGMPATGDFFTSLFLVPLAAGVFIGLLESYGAD